MKISTEAYTPVTGCPFIYYAI